MTTIILTIIGILLAAAAALMVIFYGGDAFSGGDTRAKANELINVANNVISANNLYKAEHGRDALTMEELTSSEKYLKAPLPTAARFSGTDLQVYDVNTLGYGAGMLMTFVPVELCAQVNKALKQPSQPIPTQGSQAKRIGCVEGGHSDGRGFFYATF